MDHAAEPAKTTALSALRAFEAPEAVAIARLDTTIWICIAAVGAIVALAIPVGGFRPVWSSFAMPAASFALLTLAAWFYVNVREDRKVAAALAGTAQITAFATVGAPLSYIVMAASAPFPLQDATFDSIDKALGFDWRALLAWMDAHSTLHPLFSAAYMSFTLQASLAVLALAFTGRLLWLRVFVLSFVITTLAGLFISVFVPAHDVWNYYGITRLDHPNIEPVTRDLSLTIVDGLRNGSYRLLYGIGSEGIITFPSLHAAFALVLVAAFWPVPMLRWPGLAANVVMLISTPVDGAHYLCDLIAGLPIAALAIIAARRFAAQSMQPESSADGRAHSR
jgi:hypothetical protein